MKKFMSHNYLVLKIINILIMCIDSSKPPDSGMRGLTIFSCLMAMREAKLIRLFLLKSQNLPSSWFKFLLMISYLVLLMIAHVRNLWQLYRGSLKFSMMGELSFFLGLEVKQSKDGIFLSQTKYCKKILKKFEMENCKEASTPMSKSC